MRTGLLLCLSCGAISAASADDSLPKVEDDYRTLAAGERKGKTMRELLAPSRVRKIAVIERRTTGKTSGRETNVDAAVKSLFHDTLPARDGALRAEESTVAQLVIVDDGGELWFVDVLKNFDDPASPPSAFCVRGKGFNCRFDVKSNARRTLEPTGP